MSNKFYLCVLHALFLSRAIAFRVTGQKESAESNRTTEGAESNRTTVDYVTIDSMRPGFHCPSEYYFDDVEGSTVEAFLLPDLVKAAHSWCNSELVPKNKRVPEFLRGLFWMKDLALDDVAFCPSLGEWDADTRSVKLAVWTHFVFRKGKDDQVAKLAKAAAKFLPAGNNPLIYTMTFKDDTFTKADIFTNSRVANPFIHFPLDELNATEDGQCVRKAQGDIWNRPSYFGLWFFGTDWLKFEPKGSRYYAVRVMDGNGTVRQDVYDQMKQAEQRANGDTFVRYDPRCQKNGKHVNSDGTLVR